MKKKRIPSDISKEIVSFLKGEHKMTSSAIAQLAKMSENSLLKIEQGKDSFTNKQMTRMGMRYPAIRDIFRSFYRGKMAAIRSVGRSLAKSSMEG